MQSHLGLFQFFWELIDKYALIAVPLSTVTSPSHPWRGLKLSESLPDDVEDAWYCLRDIIASRPVITFPDFSLPFQLHVDAAVGHHNWTPPVRGGVEAILTQVQKGITQPIGYFSWQFRDSENRYNKYNPDYQRVGVGYFWPSMAQDISDYVGLARYATRRMTKSQKRQGPTPPMGYTHQLELFQKVD